jgi:hypothetical protein
MVRGRTDFSRTKYIHGFTRADHKKVLAAKCTVRASKYSVRTTSEKRKQRHLFKHNIRKIRGHIILLDDDKCGAAGVLVRSGTDPKTIHVINFVRETKQIAAARKMGINWHYGNIENVLARGEINASYIGAVMFDFTGNVRSFNTFVRSINHISANYYIPKRMVIMTTFSSARRGDLIGEFPMWNAQLDAMKYSLGVEIGGREGCDWEYNEYTSGHQHMWNSLFVLRR